MKTANVSNNQIDVAITVPEWVEWVAQDSDGNWYGYSHEPMHHAGKNNTQWDSVLGASEKLYTTYSNINWRDTLYKIERVST